MINQRVFGFTQIEGDLFAPKSFVVKEVCREYIKHLHTQVRSCMPNGETITVVPDCRHALWCDCVHTTFGPLRGRVIAEVSSEAAAEEAVRVLTYGK